MDIFILHTNFVSNLRIHMVCQYIDIDYFYSITKISKRIIEKKIKKIIRII